MTITRYDGVAIIPKRCDICNRLFWLEPYNVTFKAVGLESISLPLIECRECMNQNEGRDYEQDYEQTDNKDNNE